MTFQAWTRVMAAPAMACGLLLNAGCSQEGGDANPVASEEQEHGEDGHNLHGYWCVEHGVPEEICAQCNTKLAADFQAKGDWCEEHNRPDSQCFIHHPELEDKFAAQYEAKFGEKPPEPTAEHGDHEGHEHDEHANES
jgi:hypothetical protein